jgi:hypothetical protein
MRTGSARSFDAALGSWSPGGRIYGAELGVGWMAGGAYAFFPVVEPSGVVRIYAGGRDAQGRSRLGVVTLEWDERPRVVDVSTAPVLDLGEPGSFDMDGVSYPWVVRADGELRLYYTGWNRLGGDVPFVTQLGLATSRDGGSTFARVSRAPILTRTDREPIGIGSSCVKRDGDGWTMYYTRMLSWNVAERPAKPYYNVWQAHSADGVSWERLDVNVIGHEPGEYALSAPSLHDWEGRQELYFTARGHRYRIFVAERGADGVFHRRAAPLSIAPSGWDDDMQCYPHAVAVGGRRYLLYCGNGYGRAGVGFAEWLPR